MLLCATAIINYGQVKKSNDQKRQERRERINQLIKKEEEGALIYYKQSAFGFKLNTDGWSGFYEHGKYKTISTTNIWWVEGGERKSPKEEKQSVTSFDGTFITIGNPFVYGKENNFYYLKAGFGQQRLIGGKGNKNGVAVSAVYGAGIAGGYLKPYYITVSELINGSHDIKYTDGSEAYYLDPTIIQGSPGFTKRMFEGEWTPGVLARAALRFDYGKYNEILSAVETGINAEYYGKKMPIMALNPAKHFFFNAYVAIEFGKRK